MQVVKRLGGRLRWEWSRVCLWLNDHIRIWYHDRVSASRLHPMAGDQAVSDRVAVLAIYPISGIRPPHLRSLRHLQAQGYAVFLISNLPLSMADQALVRRHVWQWAVRPNYGYDIGGYRAVIRHLAARPGGLSALRRLVLANDSIWWPLGETQDWLRVADGMEREAEGQGRPAPALIGAMTNCGIPPVPIGERQPWVHSDRQPLFHYCSFALSFGPGILSDPGFEDFWNRLRLTNRKMEIVERGEVALTGWALSRGHAHVGTWDIDGLPQRLAARDLPALRQLLEDLVIPEDHALRARRKELVADTGLLANEAALVNALLTFIAATGPAYALPAVIATEPGAGFIKVSPLRLEPEGRAATLRVLADDPELGPEARRAPLP